MKKAQDILSDARGGVTIAYPVRVPPLAGDEGSGCARRGRRALDSLDVGKAEWLRGAFGGEPRQEVERVIFYENPVMRRAIAARSPRPTRAKHAGGPPIVVDVHPFFWKIPPDVRGEIVAQHQARCLGGTADVRDIAFKTLSQFASRPERAMRHLWWFAANPYGMRMEGWFRRWVEQGVKDYLVLEFWRQCYAEDIKAAADALLQALSGLPDSRKCWAKRTRLAIKRALSVILFDGTGSNARAAFHGRWRPN